MTAAGGEAAAVIAAAGSGDRLGAGGPKALVELAGRPLLAWSLDAFAGAGSATVSAVAAPPGHEDQVEALLDAAQGPDARVVSGGATRSESVAAAIGELEAELVVVHDAARPLVTAELIDAVVGELASKPDVSGVVAAAPITDTVKQVIRGHEVERTLDRSSLWAAQTPQAFRTEALRRALGSTALLAQATDDAMLLERIGERVVLHPAPVENLKVTTELDLRFAELVLAER